MRGTLSTLWRIRHDDGIIPALAGNTVKLRRDRRNSGDHPRACGEHTLAEDSFRREAGSSPRLRGTRLASTTTYGSRGIIPALAGNTMTITCLPTFSRDHPRACGEHRLSPAPDTPGTGSSPRLRGTRPITKIGYVKNGIIPALAGNTSRCRRAGPVLWDHPRACGEHAPPVLAVPA